MAVDNAGGGGNGPIHIHRFRRLREPLTPAQQDQKLKDVAKLYEKQFLGEMLKAMRSTVSESGFVKSNQAEKIFRGELDQQYVDKWGDNGGIGLSNLIYQQLLEKLGPSLGITQPPARPQGPIQLDEKSKLNDAFATRVQKGPTDQKITVQYALDLQAAALKDNSQTASVPVTMPWKGDILGVKKLDDGEYFLDMQHDNGLRSQLTFRGKLSEGLLQGLQNPAAAGLTVGEGQQIGVLSPEARQMHWTLEKVRE
jgi:flagellar protein FlgJ